MDKIINLCKNRGFVFKNSEIYGGLANSWDFGPLGVELKNNIKKIWWKTFVSSKKNIFGLDSAILMHQKVWDASGHIGGFSDPLIDCKKCKMRFRADKLIENYSKKHKKQIHINENDFESMEKQIHEFEIKCPNCGESNFTPIRKFNLMLKTFLGVSEEKTSQTYLRPETAQGIFINFLNILRATRAKIPFGIGQIGKSFRNEITPGNFIFRTREFEQMELEFFCKEGTDEDWFQYFISFCYDFLTKQIGLQEKNIIKKEHKKEELSHYSKATIDYDYVFPFGCEELMGISNRTFFDLNAHSKAANVNFLYTDPTTKETFLPFIIEPSIGVERLMLAILCDSYFEEKVNDENRIVLKLNPALAPYTIAVLPLQKQLSTLAQKVFDNIITSFNTTYDETGSIGKRYRRQDEIGTPFCITIDFDSEKDNTFTIRERDSMKQERVSMEKINSYIIDKM